MQTVTTHQTFSALSKPLMTAKERASWSLVRAVRCADMRKPENCFEREVSETLRRILGYQASGILVPLEIMAGPGCELERAYVQRTMQASSAVNGGYLIGSEVLPLMAYLHPRSAALQLGAQIIPSLFGSSGGVPSLSGNVSIPVEDSSTEAQWIAESASSPDVDHSSTFGSAVAVPHTFYAQRIVDSTWMAQTPESSNYLTRILMGAVGAAIDRSLLVGPGGVKPLGIVPMSGAGAVSHGTNGGAPTRAKLTEAESNVIAASVPMTTAGYVLSPNARKILKNTPVVASGNNFLLETVAGVDYVNGMRALTSTAMPDNTAKGSGTNLGSLVFGDWQFAIAAIWGSLELLSDRYTQARNGQVVVSATGFADTLHPRPTAFSVSTDIVTT